MAFRHTVIIGIGGSGKWVVTHLKKMLEDANNGRIPSGIALLVLDLAGEETPPVQIEIMGEGHKIAYKLDFGEHSPQFYQFSQRWAQPIYNIKNAPDGKDFPTIRNWLKKDDADLYIIAPSDLASTHGAGQRRQTSRISLFLDFEQGDTYKRLRDAIHQAAQGLSSSESLTIHVVGSLAGGTGCGTFIDIASLAQKIALERLAGGQINLLGHFVLPKSFEAVVNEQDAIPLMDGNCYAALRELQRFMHIQPIPIQYPTAVGTVANSTRLFDVCYLVDGGRPAGSAGEDLSNVSPRLGVLPGIADFVFHHIVYPYPTDYAQVQTAITQNMVNRRPQGATIYSSFGIYQYVFDAQGVIDTFAHKLALAVLNCFLEASPKGDADVAEEVHDFLRVEGAAIFDQNVNTYLSGTIAPNITEPALFSTLRLGGNRDQASPILKLSDRVPTSTLFNRVSSETVKRQTENLIESCLGSPDDILGMGVQSYSAVLKWYRDEHARLFRERIQQKVLEILREQDGRGELRHALLFLRKLAGYDKPVSGAPGQPEQTRHVEGEYERFITLVRNTYTTLFDKPKAQVREAAARAEEDMLKGGGGGAQKRYLQAKQNELNFDRQELVFDTVMAVADDRKSICIDLRDQVKSWLDTFEEGQRVMRGAYTDLVEVRNSQTAVKVRKYVSLQDDPFENNLYELLVGGQQPSEQEAQLLRRLVKVGVRDILSEFGWWYHQGDKLECTLPAEYAPWEELRSNPLRWNYQFVRTLLGKGYFQQIFNITVMDVLALNGTTPNEVCETLSRNSEPMATLNLANHSPTRNWNTVYMPTQSDAPGASLAQEVNNTLQKLNPNTPLNHHVISYYQAYHLIGMEAFATLGNIEQVYRERLKIDPNTGRHTSPPLHNSLAEKHAARYEQLFLDVLGHDEPVRNLSLDVVHLLDDEQSVETFTLAMLNDFLKTEFNVATNQTEYIWKQEQAGQTQSHILGVDMVGCVCTLRDDQRGIRKALYDAAVQKEQNEIGEKGLKSYGDWLLEQVRTAPYLQVSPEEVTPESDLKRVMKIILWRRAQQRLKASKQQAVLSNEK